MKRISNPFLLIPILGVIIFLGLNIQKVLPAVQVLIKNIKGNDSKVYKEVKWQELKDKLSKSQISAEELNLLYRVDLKDNEINEAIDIFNSSQDSDIKEAIFNKLSFYVSRNSRNKDLFRSIAKSKDRQLSAIALNAFIKTELQRDASKNDQWTTWQWSPEVIGLLEEASDQHMYKLSQFNSLQLLKLVERYPNSKMAKGAIEYRNLVNGSEYFGYENPTRAFLRQPFYPSEEKKTWLRFIDTYPDHPGTDDAMFRIARSYEVEGDYQNAILWYYKSSQAPDGFMSNNSIGRIFLLIDSIVSSAEISQIIGKLSDKKPENNLLIYLQYSKAINLVKEDKLEDAYNSLNIFVKTYKQTKLRALDGTYIDSDSKFWNYLNNQIEDIKELQKIRNQQISDKKLYEEAAFFFNKNLLTYNFLSGDYWRLWIPEKWEGNSTYIQYSISPNLIDLFWQKHESRNEILKSLALFQKLLDEYPNSELRQKAEYSIGLNYYYLSREKWKLRSVKNPKERAVQAFNKFVKDYPKSSMADDALISIAFLGDANKTNTLNTLEKLIRDYPDGDRVKEAKKMLEDVKKEVAQQQQSGNNLPKQGLGIQMDSKPSNRGVLIVGVVLNSPANKASILQGDLLLEVNNTVVSDSNQVINIIRNSQIGQTLSLKIERQGKQQIINVTIGRLN